MAPAPRAEPESAVPIDENMGRADRRGGIVLKFPRDIGKESPGRPFVGLSGERGYIALGEKVHAPFILAGSRLHGLKSTAGTGADGNGIFRTFVDDFHFRGIAVEGTE